MICSNRLKQRLNSSKITLSSIRTSISLIRSFKMKSIVLLTLSLFLGTFFIFIGSLKVTQLIHREMHREIRRNFVQYAKVLPIDKLFGYKITAPIYRLLCGYIEIVCGSLLVLLPNNWPLKNISTIVLLGSNLLSLYTHYILNNKFERIAPSIVFSLMLACRLIVYYQVKRRVENESKQKERDERRRLIESGQFDLDQLSMSTTEEDENETIEDIDDEELERLIKINKKIHKYQKNKSVDKSVINDQTTTLEDDSVELLCNDDDLSHHKASALLINKDETKKSI